jgi:hypothetical protein
MKRPLFVSASVAVALMVHFMALGVSTGHTDIQTGVSLLNVPHAGSTAMNQPSPGAPQPAPSPQASPAATGGHCLSGAQFVELKQRLHAGGQKRAVIIRGGRYGISPYVQDMFGRVAKALKDVPKIKEMVERNLARQFLSDHAEVKKALEDAGYAVDLMASNDYEAAGKMGSFKSDLEKMLKKPETTVVVYYGHGSPAGMWIVDKRENSVPSPREFAERMRRGEYAAQCISAKDLKEWRNGNGLDALIMHGCENGKEPYLKEKGGWNPTEPTYADCIKPDGFLAGWITYSVYLNPQTLPILDQYFCYSYNKAQLAGAEKAKASRYYLRSQGLGRKIALLAGLDDKPAIAGYNCRATIETVDADADVHPHTVEELSGDAGLTAFIELLYNLKCGNGALAADVKTFLIAYFKYLKANNVVIDQPGRGRAPMFPDNPTTGDINTQLAYHGQPVLAGALEALVPQLVLMRHGSVSLSDADPSKIFLDLHMDIRKTEQLEEVLAILKGAYEADVAQGIHDGVGFNLGPQIAPRVKATADGLIRALPSTVIEVKMSLALEKVVVAGGNKFKPTVFSYNLAIGTVPAAKKASKEAPYEIHIGMPTASTLANQALSGLFGPETKLYSSWAVDLYARLWRSYGVRRVNNNTVTLPMRWEVRGDYPVVDDGYGYLFVDLDLAATPAGNLKLNLTPTVRLRFEEGWPFPDWAGNIIAGWISDDVTAKARARLSSIDFADYIPADVKPEIVGVVKIDRVQVDPTCISVYIKHVR